MAAKKTAQEELQLWQMVAPVEFSVISENPELRQSTEIKARQSPGLVIAAGQVAHGIFSRATQILLDFSQQHVAMRYQIDGLWEQLPPMSRDVGDAMLVSLKQLCLLNPEDRKTLQSGTCCAKVKRDKYNVAVQSQGVPTGERVLLRIEPCDFPFSRLADLGMRDKMQENFRATLNGSGGIILVSAPKGSGLTTTWRVALEAADRFMRDFQSIEHEDLPEPETINIASNIYGESTGIPISELLRSMILKEPDVFVFPEPPDSESLGTVIDQLKQADKHLYTRLVASDAVEAAVKFISKHRSRAKDIAKNLTVVTSQRLTRRLCDNCKQGFQPSPQLLQRLGIPQGRVGVLYQPFVPPPIEEQVDEKGRPAPIAPCTVCNARGYFGRVGIFELLQPGPQFRAALLKTQDLDQLRRIAKSEGHQGLQGEAVLAVARGLTSLDELKRVFSNR